MQVNHELDCLFKEENYKHYLDKATLFCEEAFFWIDLWKIR